MSWMVVSSNVVFNKNTAGGGPGGAIGAYTGNLVTGRLVCPLVQEEGHNAKPHLARLSSCM